MERRDNPLKIVRLTIIAFVSLIIGLSLIGDARSQVRYEYRVQPEGSGPILIPCMVIDRFNYLCIETGEIFTDTALYAPPHNRKSSAPAYSLAHQKLARDGWVDRSYNKKGERCCDQGKDCHSLNPEEVKPTEGGVMLTFDGREIFIPGDQIMPSEDGKFWVCYWGERVRCFFAPYNGS